MLKFYDCLVFTQIITSHPLVAVFEFLVVRTISIQCFYFLVTALSACQLSLSTKKIRGAALGTAAGCRGIFCLYFSDTTLLPALLQKGMKYVNVILFRIACYTIKIQNCPPKDIFKKFERKAHNHSTLVQEITQNFEVKPYTF